MSDKSKIEWTRGDDGTPGATWNPLIGCSHVSAGCDNCYAARYALRNLGDYAGLAERTDKGVRFTGEIRTRPAALDQPLRWKRPRRIFVNSMSDLFHKDVPWPFIASVFDVMKRCPQHTFQVLTKRPQRLHEELGWEVERAQMYGSSNCATSMLDPNTLDERIVPLRNVWLGTSIESDRYTFRADHLRAAPAAVRWLSLEPLLGQLPSLDLTGIDWVVVGGESGPGARPMHPDWARDIRDRCVAAGVPFHFKQRGEWTWEMSGPYREVDLYVSPDGQTARDGDSILDSGEWQGVWRVGKHAAGRELDGRTWDEWPVTV